jgi:hypothetical protein
MTVAVTNATTRTTTTDNTDITDETWLPSGSLQDGDTLIINHIMSVGSNIDYSSLNLIIYVNADWLFSNPSYLRLGSESEIYFTVPPVLTGDNGNDKIKIGSTVISESDLASVLAGDKLTDEGVVVPVELINFDISAINNMVELYWSTASEINNHFFLIEKSSDGIDWIALDYVEGAGTTSEVNEYSYLDFTDSSSINYYRLSQYDYDGTREYLCTLLITLETNMIQGIKIPIHENVQEIQYYTFDGRRISTLDSPNKYILIIVTDKGIYKRKVWR